MARTKFSKARDGEVYAKYEMIDLGSGKQKCLVIYPKNKMITKEQREKAVRKFRKK